MLICRAVGNSTKRAFDAFDPPQGYTWRIAGEQSDLETSQRGMLRALAVAPIAVYLLLVAQFRSFVHPLTVMLAVPLVIIGVAPALATKGRSPPRLWLVGYRGRADAPVPRI